MRKRRIIILFGVAICLGLAAIAAVAFKPAPHPEPSYDGMLFSDWVAVLASQPIPEDAAAAAKAIDHIGVAALPCLLERIQYEQPAWRAKLANQLRKFPYKFTGSLAQHIAEPKAAELAQRASEAFIVLGPMATPAVDALLRLSMNRNAPETATRASFALSWIGTNLPAGHPLHTVPPAAYTNAPAPAEN